MKTTLLELSGPPSSSKRVDPRWMRKKTFWVMGVIMAIACAQTNAHAATWRIETIASSTTNDMYITALALDSAGQPHICYSHSDGSFSVTGLWYASLGATGWVTQVVDGPGTMGFGISLVIDSSDHPHVAYQSGAMMNTALVPP